ncbi:MAG: AAA family ATPase [Acidobacteria bacterium]|uniref:AAA family ATPase n=1 Tax=Candidatus Polarisedimenticola svalbardensis TaxID=2886004 RepID=A0A8J7CEU3_9BACT|nr:AAA family ATPase [Candidatus Polarisedimenticola svalbardensis]
MKLSTDLQIAISVAMTEAAGRGHEFAGLEHMMVALLLDEKTSRVLRHAGADTDVLKEGLIGFLDEEVEVLPVDKQGDPELSRGIQSVMTRALAHTEGAGRQEMEGYDILVAMFDEPDCFAVHFLEQAGVTRLDIVNYLAHGISQIDPAGVPAGAPLDDDEDTAAADPLDSFTRNLTALAREGKIDPLIGREREIDRAIHILQRRRKNNPVLVGDPGVGKTALVEGLAWLIAHDNVPDPLKGVAIHSLDMGALLAGTRYRGDFENRMKGVLHSLESKAHSILFIDEIHTLVGAGATGSGTTDASSLLKPSLEAGAPRFIGATTWEDFRQYFERDRALARRFQKVEIKEPSVEDTVKILQGLKSRYEDHHGIRYTKAALTAAAELAGRHLRDRKLPDKAIDLMDEAGATAALAGRKQVGALDVERVLAGMAQIPLQTVKGSDRDRLKGLEDQVRGVVFGQDHAIEKLITAIKMARAGLGRPDTPVGSFLLTGPTGVGKTEVAKQLAVALGIAFLRFDMSEYMERHSVSRLVGAPPGYVGYDRGGLLTEAVNQSPHAVLLLDEIEKAHPDVFNILLQIMDHGTLTDTNGKETDFRQVVLLMTSNVGARELAGRQVGFDGGTTREGADQQAYEKMFNPEFRNRLDGRISFKPLSTGVMKKIVDKFLAELRDQLKDRKVELTITDEARELLARLGYDPAFGARFLARLIDEKVKKPLTDQVLFGKLENGGTARILADGDAILVDYS